MSNKFKIKNIWTPEVSREEYAKTLKEFDDAITSLYGKIGKVYDILENRNLNKLQWIFKSTMSSYSANTWNIINNHEPMLDDFIDNGVYQLLIYYNGSYWYYYSTIRLLKSKSASPQDSDNTICDFSFYDNNKQLHFAKINFYGKQIRIKFDSAMNNIQIFIYPLKVKEKFN